MYKIQRSNDYLYHHGILGQKWGKRNGPPYPLGPSDHSASEKKAGWRQSLGGSSSNTSDNTSKSTPTKAASTKGVDPETGFNKLSKSETDDERLARCNPLFKRSTSVTPYNRNCGNTVISDELRKRGLDVQARGNNFGLTVNNMSDFFETNSASNNQMRIKAPNLKGSTIRALMFGKGEKDKVKNEILKRGEIVQNELSKQIASKYSDGSRGALCLTGLFGSHWISFDVKGGKTIFANPQDPSENLLMDFGCYKDYGKANPTTSVRLDNLKINKSSIKNVVMNYGDTKADAKGMSFNPLESKSNAALYGNPNVQKMVSRAFGDKWDGSWEEFDNRTQSYKKKEK